MPLASQKFKQHETYTNHKPFILRWNYIPIWQTSKHLWTSWEKVQPLFQNDEFLKIKPKESSILNIIDLPTKSRSTAPGITRSWTSILYLSFSKSTIALFSPPQHVQPKTKNQLRVQHTFSSVFWTFCWHSCGSCIIGPRLNTVRTSARLLGHYWSLSVLNRKLKTGCGRSKLIVAKTYIKLIIFIRLF